MVERLRARREELARLLQETAMRLEQLRGALALCSELLAEAEGDGAAPDAPAEADA